MAIYSSMEQLIGATPMLELCSIAEQEHTCARILAKLEFFNPAGSVKDRPAKKMLDEAEKQGLIRKGSVIIEPTSGNTGIGLCAVAAARGYSVMIVMPESMSMERRLLMAAYGAQVVLSPADKGMAGAIEMAKQLQESIPGSFIPQQFENPANPQAHFETTGPEIWADTQGNVDILVAGIGTGGTITGIGKYLKGKKDGIRIVSVEPAASNILSGGKPGSHSSQGIGANFVPEILDTALLDAVIPVRDEDALETARRMGRTEGILVGISSGAALWAAIQLAKQEENAGKTIAVILPDSGERYLSSGLYK